jgi:NTE family protein
MPEARPRLALVIGSGSVKCAAALGLWKVFQREGIELDMLVGCSGGSMYAAAIALGYSLATAEQMTLDFWTGDLMSGYAANLKAAMSGEQKFTESSGLVDGAPLLEIFGKIFGSKTFAQTSLPLHIVATDFLTGEKVVLSSGSIVDAVRASTAIPMIFPPWEINGQLLTDGAVCDPLPVDVAIKEGANIILAMGFELTLRKRLRTFNAVQSHLNAIYMNHILRATYAFYNLAHHAEIIPVIPEFDDSISNFDTASLPAIIALGETAAEEQLPYITRLLGR